MLKLRADTTDLMCFREVVLENEYHLPDRMDGWKVLDVGAHIGCFALACLIRGAKHIHCFESDQESYDQLNLSGMTKISTHNEAVWRGDLNVAVMSIDVGKHPQKHNPGANGAFVPYPKTRVEARSLDTILHWPGYQPFDLLKLDCEGSEYPILLSSKRFSDVPAICGEWHTVDPAKSRPFGLGEWSPQRLRTHLCEAGYTCEFVQQVNYPHQGLFWAWKDRENPFKGLKRDL